MFPKKYLKPRLDLLREEYVLVQAWKKAASYIRYHNWFSDTLALDRASVNLPTFIGELRERLQSADSWRNEPLRIVPAPKSEDWGVSKDHVWRRIEKEKKAEPAEPRAPFRPLAHVDLVDQVVATALMLCLADQVETVQGDTRQPITDEASRKRVISYGNRLFCDAKDGKLRHRWGAAKLYRAYFQDYRKFVSRPEVVFKSLADQRAYVVHTDIRQFYDRVRPKTLFNAIAQVRKPNDDSAFFSFLESVLDWGWHADDKGDARQYADSAGIEDFTRVALPQGLVASGFFANIALFSFDDAMRRAIGTKIAEGITLVDFCRYVDDLRIVVTVAPNMDCSSERLEEVVFGRLNRVLEKETVGLKLSSDKTKVASSGGDDRPLIRQSAKMDRIQSAVSGGFDVLGGEEILAAIQGLMRSQEILSAGEDSNWRFSPVPDMRDQTVARFSAARYRTTYRSIRPLLDAADMRDASEIEGSDVALSGRARALRTQRDLDDDAKAFALDLIQRWVRDPSNVRLLRIGLDLWPDAKLLREILSLIRPLTKPEEQGASWRIACYCLAEILRAGATEMGLVPDAESLPADIDLAAYRQELSKEAARLIDLGAKIPWYLRQQALLFLAAYNAAAAPASYAENESENQDYRALIRFLRGERDRLQSSEEFAMLAVLARRAFAKPRQAIVLTASGLNAERAQQIAQRDPSFLREIIDAEADAPGFDVNDLPLRIREDLCLNLEHSGGDREILAKAVLDRGPRNPLRNELSLLYFAESFLEQWQAQESPPEAIPPAQIELALKFTPEEEGKEHGIATIENLRILPKSQAPASGSMYKAPAWCKPRERWRFHLGFLLRFILSGQPDFTRFVRSASWKETESCYRPAASHWYQRLYGFYNGQQAFGDDWLPITDWTERFLLALLRWPGCRNPKRFGWVEQGDIDKARARIRKRIARLEKRRGNATGTLMLRLMAKRPTAMSEKRPLRACVVQTVIPNAKDICENTCDLKLDGNEIRRKHRAHLSATLAAVERMLTLRATHMDESSYKAREGRLDWLIFPELAVHPDDVLKYLIPFARAYKTIILAGLTYEEVLSGEPLVNSALWIIPEWSDAYGLQIKTRRQGKKYLAPKEEKFNKNGAPVLQGFRPCQWLIGYPWSGEDNAYDQHDGRPVWLTAAVCYDATDIGLAADLRNRSDILAIPALNKDVKTFDNMALALHYHMFQLVVVANNGKYGGSSVYWPKTGEYNKQIFHVHGQPQASVSFFEIENAADLLQRHDASGDSAGGWKHPPAGLEPGG